MELESRVILITGAARRVGRAIALRMAREKCRLALHYNTSAAEAESTAAECRALGAQAEAFRAALDEPEAAVGLASDVLAQFGAVDVLVNNAAIFERDGIDDFSLERWDRTLRINLTAPLLLTHALRDALRAARGRVINFCDAATPRASPAYLSYGVSKAALEMLTRVLARSLAPDVNVVGVAPGIVAWPDDYDAAQRSAMLRNVPLARTGSPEDVAATVRFLLGEGDYISGAIVPVDGGWGVT